MPLCKGRIDDGTKCGKNVKDDRWCLAHKLKTLPREIVALIFSKMECLEELYHYARIYSEAIPAYLQRRLEVGKYLANELLLLNGLPQITTDNRQVIDQTVWKMLFTTVRSRIAGSEHATTQQLKKLYYTQCRLYVDALDYCMMQFESDDSKKYIRIFREPWVKRSIIQGHLTEQGRARICQRLITICTNFSIEHQMVELANFLEETYPFLNFTSSDGKIQILYRLISQISEIEVDGKRLFHLPTVEKILS